MSGQSTNFAALLVTVTGWQKRSTLFAIGMLLCTLPISNALAWGHTGHVSISQLAILQLPEEVPAFLRSDQAARRIGELGAEADESKTTGIVLSGSDTGRIQTAPTVHDAERDPGHFIDIAEDHLVLGGSVNLFSLPPDSGSIRYGAESRDQPRLADTIYRRLPAVHDYRRVSAGAKGFRHLARHEQGTKNRKFAG